jgi:tetratricopeptide (TPR) repeat protein
MSRTLLALGFALLPLAIALGCSTGEVETSSATASPEIVFSNLGSTSEYVGDTVCFDCHEDQYQGFYEHGMANSMYLLTKDNAVEAFGSEIVVDSTTGLHYEMVEADSGYIQIEFLLDERGERTHELARTMKWVVGSGTTARTYLAEQDGWFYEMPVTWYTQQGRWDFSPGYRVANKRFNRKIADRCVVCHNSYPEPVEQTNGMFTEMPTGIGCERCHGPGSDHVEARLVSDPPEGQPDVTIVNPAHLSLDLRLDVCQQCHLNGTVSLLRDDEDPYSYRPSQPLEEYVALYTGLEFIEGEGEGISVISHADRMKQSACYTETLDTLRPLECTTCHDPHEGFRDQGDAYFNVTCMSCHVGEDLSSIDAGQPLAVHTTSANCVECHMPPTDLIEAPHSAFTDHYIRVVDQDELEPEKSTETDALMAHFNRDRIKNPEARLYEGMAYITRGYQGGDIEYLNQGVDILDEVFESGHQFSEAVYLHGYALLILKRFDEAIPSLEESVRLEPNKAERLNALAQAYEYAGDRDPVRIERLYREALRVQPKLADIRLNLGRFLQSRGRIDDARGQYRQVVEDESWNALGYYNLGTLALLEGNLEEAEEQLGQSLTLDPLSGATLTNLGLVHLQKNKIAEARRLLETAVERDPELPEALDNLGSLYLNLEVEEEAVTYLKRATEVRPYAAGIHAKLALAYFRLERYSEAQRSAQQALAIDPNESLAQQIMLAL